MSIRWTVLSAVILLAATASASGGPIHPWIQLYYDHLASLHSAVHRPITLDERLVWLRERVQERRQERKQEEVIRLLPHGDEKHMKLPLSRPFIIHSDDPLHRGKDREFWFATIDPQLEWERRRRVSGDLENYPDYWTLTNQANVEWELKLRVQSAVSSERLERMNALYWYESNGYLRPDELVRYRLEFTLPDAETAVIQSRLAARALKPGWPTPIRDSFYLQRFQGGAEVSDPGFMTLRAVYQAKEKRVLRSISYPLGENSPASWFYQGIVTETVPSVYGKRGHYGAGKIEEVKDRELVKLDRRRATLFYLMDQTAHHLDHKKSLGTLRLFDGSAHYTDPRLGEILKSSAGQLPLKVSYPWLKIPEGPNGELGLATKSREIALPLASLAEVAVKLLELHSHRDAEGRLIPQMPADFRLYATGKREAQAEVYKVLYGFKPADFIADQPEEEEILWMSGQEFVDRFLAPARAAVIPDRKEIFRDDERSADILKGILLDTTLRESEEGRALLREYLRNEPILAPQWH